MVETITSLPIPQWSQKQGGKRGLLNLSKRDHHTPTSSPAHDADRWVVCLGCDN